MPAEMKLGRTPARLDPRTFRLAKYVSDLPPAPRAMNWFRGKKDWGQMRNDVLGDCVFAGIAHAIQLWSNATGTALTFDDELVVSYYSAWAGYDPKDPNTDQGANELDVLNKWRNTADGFGGQRLVAYADPDPRNEEHVRQAILRFGCLYIGLGLPQTAQSQEVWDYVPNTPANRPWTWGGHCVIVGGFDEQYLYAITWGEAKKMTWEFWRRYCDESHALLSQMWLERATPAFHFVGDLQKDLALVTG